MCLPVGSEEKGELGIPPYSEQGLRETFQGRQGLSENCHLGGGLTPAGHSLWEAFGTTWKAEVNITPIYSPKPQAS